MAIQSTLSQIEEVQAAITAVMSGQSYRIGNMTYTRASLESLTKREEMLLSRYYKEQGNNPRVSRVTFADAAYRNEGEQDEKRTC
jgi:hypothetical protein